MFRRVKLSVPFLPLLRYGEFHIVSADDVFKRLGLHFEHEGGECFREQLQFLLLPSFGFFEIFRFAGLRGKRTGRETGECVEDAPDVMTMGDALKDLAEVARVRLCFHRRSIVLGKEDRRYRPVGFGDEVELHTFG